VVGIGLTRINDEYGLKVNLGSAPGDLSAAKRGRWRFGESRSRRNDPKARRDALRRLSLPLTL